MEEVAQNTSIPENHQDESDKQEQIPQTQENPLAEEKAPEKEKEEELDLKDRSYENIEKVTEAKGINFKDIRQEFVNNGCELTDKIIEKYVKAGIPLEDVKEIAQSFKALHDKEMDTIAQVVGGRENLTATLEWARDNIETEKLNAIREDLSKNPSELTAKAIISYLHGQMVEKEGIAPKYLSNTAGGNMNTDIFKSKAEVMKAMSDPRYIPTNKDYDEAFAKEIDDKLERTNQANGKPLFE